MTLALSVVLAGGISAEAAQITASKTLTGINSGDSVSFDAVKVKKGVAEYNAAAKWDLYTSSTSVDISNLKTTKDTYFAVKGTSTVDIYKVLADKQKKFAATCDGDTITITVDKKAVEGADIAKFSWRTENSGWTAFQQGTALDLTPYTMQGATLYIRYTGAGNTINATPNSTKAEEIEVPGQTSKVQVKEIPADSFYAKEFKVKVPKKANAPAISVDYVNGVIKANKKAVCKDNATLSGAISAQWSTSTMSENYTIDTSSAKTFMMQIPADTAKKKAASKISFFSWTAVTAPQVNYNAASVTTTNKTGDLISGTDGKVSYKAVDNAKVEKATFEISTTDTKNTYEIFKAKTVDGKKVADGKAIATLKPGAKPVVLTSKKVSKDTELIIRFAGDKKAAKLPSPFATNAVTPVYLETPAATN